MLLLAAACFALVPQRFVANDALQPRTYTSPSGEWTLFVDPSARDGAGESTVRIAKQSKTQWTGEKPFTFQDAVIDDTGISAGYAYTLGKEGRSEVGALVVALIGASGDTLLVDETPREFRGSSHSPPNPCAQQILLHPGLRSVVVRLDQPGADDSSECWFVYTLSPAKKLEPVRGERELQAADQQVSTFAIAAIRGTPLTLAHWRTPGHWDVPGSGTGSEFALYDESWKLVWSLPLPGDLELEDDDEEWRLFREILDQGAILGTSVDRRFELRHVAKSERVTYEVAQDAAAKTGWSVREVARAPFERKAVAEPKKLTNLQLTLAASAALDVAPAAPGPVRDIQAFAPEAAGGFTFVRGEKLRHAVTLVTIDSTGAVQRQVAIAPIEPDADGSRDWFPLSGGEWMMTVSPWDGEERISRAWRVDGATGAASELTEFHGPDIEQVVPAADGGFVVLGTHHLRYTMQGEVRRCARNGTTLWSHRETGYGQCENPSDLCSPEAIAVAIDGSVLVLDDDRNLLQFFDAAGAYLRSLEFATSWDIESSYLTGLLLEPSGNYLVCDHHDERLLRRLQPDGKQITAIQFQLENGSKDAGLPICVDANGRLWGSDGRQFLEYGEDGIVRGRFGLPPDPARLGEVGHLLFDGRGRLVIEDARTHALHLFKPDGSRALVCIPGATDFDEEYSIDAVYSAPDGTIYVQPNDLDDDYLTFGADGKRTGRMQLGGTRVAFDSRTRARWVGGEGDDDAIHVRRFAADGKLEFETDRRPDGGFFGAIKALAVGPDGSLAVLDGPDDLFGSGRCTVSLFSAKGEPQRVIELPEYDSGYESHMQYGRRWIVISGYYPTARVVSVLDGQCALFEAADPEKDDGLWAIGLSPDEKELWALGSSPTTLHRFTLPQ